MNMTLLITAIRRISFFWMNMTLLITAIRHVWHCISKLSIFQDGHDFIDNSDKTCLTVTEYHDDTDTETGIQ